jgi:hypothetical protein
MNHPRRRADFGIGKGPHIFFEEINQPSLALEHGQNGQSGGEHAFGRQFGGFWCGRRLGWTQQCSDLAAKVTATEGASEAR